MKYRSSVRAAHCSLALFLVLGAACGNGAAFVPPPPPDDGTGDALAVTPDTGTTVDSGPCTPGFAVDCRCPDGTIGAALCLPAGVPGTCVCASGDGGTRIDARADASDAAVTADVRPLDAADVVVIRPDVVDVVDVVTVTDVAIVPLACADRQLGAATGSAVATGTTVGRTNNYTPSCSTGTTGAPDISYSWTAPAAATYRVSTAGSSFDTVLEVFAASCTGTLMGCNDDDMSTGVRVSTSAVTFSAAAGQAFVIIVDGYNSAASGTYTLSITQSCTPGSTQSCYTGSASTRHAGRCTDGTQTCNAGVFGTCTGQVLPAAAETCGNGIDDDCNGLTDDNCRCGSLADCSGTCTNVNTDRANCGACGVVCGTGQSCTSGLCCAAGQSRCGSACVNLQSDLANCGSCGAVCTATFPQTAACTSGACMLTCGAGYHQCGTVCALNSSTATCGASCTPCPSGLSSSPTCNGTTCGITCATGYADCNGIASDGCEARLASDPAHCGTCGTACAAVAHAASACNTNAYPYTPQCAVGACETGYTDCNGTVSDGCEAHTSADTSNCGTCYNVCPTGQSCVSGACTLVCSGSQVVCSGQCVDTQSSATNCGACGTRCAATERCSTGACASDAAVEIASGAQFRCVRKASGGVACWGYGAYGQLGNGTTAAFAVAPVSVGVINDAVQLSAGGNFACAVRSDTSVWCWGDNGSRQLATSSVSYSPTPVRIGTLTGIAEVRCGTGHACARSTAGVVTCWGGDYYGQVGNGTSTTYVTTPTAVNGLSGTAVSLSAGAYHTCAVDNIGLVNCWGYNASGQLGTTAYTSSNTPVVVNGLVGVSRLADSLGADSSCAIRSAGTVACWGANTVGQLGNGTTTATTSVGTVSALTSVDRVSSGDQYSCAHRTNGEVWCWGNNANGQLGNGTVVLAPRPVQPLDRFASSAPFTGVANVSSGGSATCAVTSAGAVRCWGSNTYGQLGDRQLLVGDIYSLTEIGTDRAYPQPVVGFSPVVAEDGACFDGRDNDNDGRTDGDDPDCATDLGSSLGRAVFASLPQAGWANYNRASCALHNTADVLFKWVAPTTSTFAIDTRESSFDTVLAVRAGTVGGSEAACNDNESTLTTTSKVTFSATAGSTYFILVDGYRTTGALALSIRDTVADAACTNTQTDRLNCGACGHACTTDQRCMTGACVADRVVEAVSGAAFACVRREAGDVSCWGDNSTGQLGNGGVVGTSQPATVPIPISYVTDATQLCAGTQYACALRADGRVSCWGNGANGQLGENTTTAVSKWPTSVAGLANVAEVRCGALHACARTTAGDVWCWGNNGSGRLGDGTTTTRTSPVRVGGLRASASVYAGGAHSCSVGTDANVQCWGDDTSGQLGDGGTAVTSATPIAVAGVSSAARLADGSGDSFTCVRLADSTVWCWGRNLEGQLGRGASGSPATPAVVNNVVNVTQLALGGATACARLTSGNVQCWGDNSSGQLGLGTTINGPSPAIVRNRFAAYAALDGVQSISASSGAVCAVRSDASVMCWGSDASNRLGDWQRISQAVSRWYPQPVVAYPPLAGEDGNCTDGVDNDNDGSTDGLDADCATDITNATGTGSFPLTFDGRNGNYNAATCGGSTGRDLVLRWRAPVAGSYTFDTRSSTVTTVLSLHNGAYEGAELGCGLLSSARLSITATANQVVYVVVDTVLTGTGGSGTLVVTSP